MCYSYTASAFSLLPENVEDMQLFNCQFNVVYSCNHTLDIDCARPLNTVVYMHREHETNFKHEQNMKIDISGRGQGNEPGYSDHIRELSYWKFGVSLMS